MKGKETIIYAWGALIFGYVLLASIWSVAQIITFAAGVSVFWIILIYAGLLIWTWNWMLNRDRSNRPYNWFESIVSWWLGINLIIIALAVAGSLIYELLAGAPLVAGDTVGFLINNKTK